jgi:hypothetical protein
MVIAQRPWPCWLRQSLLSDLGSNSGGKPSAAHGASSAAACRPPFTTKRRACRQRHRQIPTRWERVRHCGDPSLPGSRPLATTLEARPQLGAPQSKVPNNQIFRTLH